MRGKPSFPVIIGLLGVVYFLATVVLVQTFVQDQMGSMILLQFLNIPVAAAFGIIGKFVPYAPAQLF